MSNPIPFDLRAARAYGEICHQIFAIGRHPRWRMTDLMIGATAMAEGRALVTRNPGDFTGLDELLTVIRV